MAKGPTLVRPAGLVLSDPLPASETERVQEADRLIEEIVVSQQMHLLTTWETELVAELKQGRACTRVRLKELREAVKRIREFHHAKTERH